MEKKKVIQLIVVIIFIIIIIITIPYLASKEKTSEPEAVSQEIKRQETSEPDEEELAGMFSPEDEIGGRVLIENTKAFYIYDPPANMMGNLPNFMWLWIKYYTRDEDAQWHVTLNGVSYEEDDECIIFDALIEEYPGEIIQCTYYKKRHFFDFYNSSIMDTLSEKNAFEELSEE